jgi:hypothetical protein
LSEHRRMQNVRLPRLLRKRPTQTSIVRTVREIQDSWQYPYQEMGKATIFERECVVGTIGGKVWLIVEIQDVQGTKENPTT